MVAGEDVHGCKISTDSHQTRGVKIKYSSAAVALLD